MSASCAVATRIPGSAESSGRSETLPSRTLAADARRLVDIAAGGPWRLVWCAGAKVNGADRKEFADELFILASVLDGIEMLPDAQHGTILHASSAGGVYAGAPGAPYNELSDVQPLGDYGRAKLAAEAIVRKFGARSGAQTIVARLANLYGPGQNLSKPQGLISHLCRGYLVSAPVSIYVPMDTIRDYLFVADAAAMVADAMDLADTRSELSVTKIFASGNSVTIGAILSACRTVFRRRPNVVLANSRLASLQSHDLRLRSVIWPEVDRRTHRTLLAGIGATLQATRESLSR